MVAVYQPIVSEATMAKAERIAEMIPTLSRGRCKETGIIFVIVPSSDNPERVGHTATALKCSCKGFDRNGTCSHQIACQIVLQRQTAARIAAAQQLRKENGVCVSKGCVFTAIRPNGRCADHNRVLCDAQGY